MSAFISGGHLWLCTAQLIPLLEVSAMYSQVSIPHEEEEEDVGHNIYQKKENIHRMDANLSFDGSLIELGKILGLDGQFPRRCCSLPLKMIPTCITCWCAAEPQSS
jgi:hypothetical protein